MPKVLEEAAIAECNDNEEREEQDKEEEEDSGKKGMTMDHDETLSLFSGTDPESPLIGQVFSTKDWLTSGREGRDACCFRLQRLSCIIVPFCWRASVVLGLC